MRYNRLRAGSSSTPKPWQVVANCNFVRLCGVGVAADLSAWSGTKGIIASQVTPAARPSRVGQAIRFAASQYFQTAAFAEPIAQPFTVYLVAQCLTPSNYALAFDGISSGGSVGIYSSTTNHVGIYAGKLGTVSEALTTTKFAAAAIVNGASSVLHVKGFEPVTDDAGAHALDGVTIGDRSDADGQWWQDDEYCMIVFSGSHNAATLNYVLGWCAYTFSV
jgi:hypothetical protein